MHLGVLTTGYPHVHDPVSGAFVRAMALALAARGHALTVLCAQHPTDAPIEDPGIMVHPVRYQARRAWQTLFHGGGAPDQLAARGTRAWTGALAYPPALALAAHRRLPTCDALISHFVLPCAAVGGLVARGRPHLAIAHGTDAQWLARMPGFVQRGALRGATSIQFTHEAAREAMDPTVRFDPRVFVAPMGFEPMAPGDRAASRDALGVGDAFVVLAVARLVPVKGLDVLVGAAHRLPDHVTVVIVGDGPEGASLRAKAPPSVRFVGVCTAAERDRWLAAADLFAAPARVLPDGRTDSAPVAVIEALGAGLPVVHTGVGGLNALVGDAGWRAAPDDERSLAEAILQATHHPTDLAWRASRARRRVEAFRWDVQAAAIEARLSGGSPGP